MGRLTPTEILEEEWRTMGQIPETIQETVAIRHIAERRSQ